MQFRKRVCNLAQKASSQFSRQGALLHQFAQAASSDKLHHQIWSARINGAMPDNLYNIGV